MSKLMTAIKSNPNKGNTSLFVRVSTAMKITQLACITYGKSINCLVIYCYINPTQTKGRHHYSLSQPVCTLPMENLLTALLSINLFPINLADPTK